VGGCIRWRAITCAPSMCRKRRAYVQDQWTQASARPGCLPTKGGFQFAARFYGPYGPLIDGSYNMPGVVRVD
jgi:hypothetical protein